MNPKVDAYIKQEKQWREETGLLREIALGCGLVEELKWGKPCYTFQGGNVAIIQGFKAYCALMFFKGALLKDPKGILQKPGVNSQSAHQARFTSASEIAASKATLQAYLKEAIALEKAGLKVELKKSPEPTPPELQAGLDGDAALRKAFAALTPGRQRSYILHISSAKQAATRASRVEKCKPGILAGRGFNER